MKIATHSAVPVYTVSGGDTSRKIPEWLARKRKRSLKNDPEYANRIELLQDFEFQEASSCVRVSEDGEWLMSTGMVIMEIYFMHRLTFFKVLTNRKSMCTIFLILHCHSAGIRIL